VVNATMYGPEDAARAGFLDRVLGRDELRAASIEGAGELAELNATAHTATKLRARGSAIAAVRAAIESELSADGLRGASAPA
jgi:enoyl-CoA hydratase